MRHPFWTWTGWLTLGLAGCIHGADGRKAATHAVSDRNTSTPMVVGPFRKSVPQFAPAESKSTARVRHDSQVLPAQLQQPQTSAAEPALFPAAISLPPQTTTHRAIPAAMSPAVHAAREPSPFAEFDRAIPLASKGSKSPVTPVDHREPVLVPPAESDVEFATDKPELEDAELSEPNWDALPMIVPAQQFSTKSTAPHELPPQVTGLFQERSSVAETSKPTARPRDVAVLVEQVFEDLRQRRLDDARERTEWLKRLVAKGSNPTHTATDEADANAESSNRQAEDHAASEPQRLQVDDGTALSRETNSADAVPLNK